MTSNPTPHDGTRVPEPQGVQRLLVGQGHRRGHRREEHRDALPGQSEGQGVARAPADARQAEDDDPGDSRAHEGEPDVLERVGEPEQGDDRHHGEGGPGVDAQQSRVGDRVARVPLDQCAAHAQGQARHDREDRAGHAHGLHDEPDLGELLVGLGVREQAVPDLGGAQRACSDGQRHRRRDHQGRREDAQPHGPPSAGPVRPPGHGALHLSREHVEERYPFDQNGPAGPARQVTGRAERRTPGASTALLPKVDGATFGTHPGAGCRRYPLPPAGTRRRWT